MDINIGETAAGRLKMELFSDIVPRSANSTASMAMAMMPDFKPAHFPGQRRTSGNYALGNTGNIFIVDLARC